MLNYSNVITKENSYSGIQMKEIRPVMKLIIRGKINGSLAQSWWMVGLLKWNF